MIIKSRKELREVLNYERERWRKSRIKSELGWIKANIMLYVHPGCPYTFMYCLRCEEYYQTQKGLGRFVLLLLKYRHRQLSNKTGIELFPGCAEIGVKFHHGKSVVSKDARIGRDTIILSDTTLGGVGGKRNNGAPTIGERCFVSSGVRIIGNITIANNVVIGANAVVVKDISEPGITVAGIPARKISDKGAEYYITIGEDALL